MTVISPDTSRVELSYIEWGPLLAAHSNKSCTVEVSDDHRLIKKTKKRTGRKRDTEFYNLDFWHNLLKIYSAETGSKVFSPKPHYSEERDLIMDYVAGIDLDRLLRSRSTASDEMGQIIYSIGQLFRIKTNEDLFHNDFDLRHLMIDGGLYVIDLENARYGNGEVVAENEELARKIKIFYNGEVDSLIADGFSSVPEIGAFDGALSAVEENYGSVARNKILTRYRKINLRS